MAQLCQQSNQLENLNVKVFIITFGNMLGAQNWLKETCSPFKLLLDPDRSIYERYGLERSYLRSWNLRTIWMYIKLMSSHRKWRGIQGDSAQLGGDFVIDSKGIVKLAYRSHDPTDRPSVSSILELIHQIRGENILQE